MQQKSQRKILFTGGATAGPVVPLLAVWDKLSKEATHEALWIGTKFGPEKQMIEKEKIDFVAIESGKLRRYFSWRNFIDPFLIIVGFFQSLSVLMKKKPDLVMSAGAFVSVPVVWAAWLLRIPVIIHQQDVVPGLANKLMSPFARRVTCTFEKSLDDYGSKAIWTGNPVRQDFLTHKLSKREAAQKFGLRTEKPIVIVMGGGTGASFINEILLGSMKELARFCQVIHITGKGKAGEENDKMMETVANYKYFEFMDKFGMIKAYTVADCVVSRCGMGTLTELSALGIKSILIPMPGTHQEANARVFEDHQAALVIDQKKINKEGFISCIKKVISEKDYAEAMSDNIKKVMKVGAADRVVKLIKDI